MGDIGALIIRIGADASQLEKAFHDLGGSAKQFQRGLDSISKTMQTVFLAGVTGAIAMAIQAGKTAEETEQLAQKTGIAAVSIEGMSVAMARHGLSAENLSMAVKGLSAQMVGVKQGTASAVQLFDQMGLSLGVVQRGTGATLRAIADRFKEIPDGAEKARFAVELFGKAGLDWIPILNRGGAALDAAMAKSAEFGLVLTDTARNQLTVFDDAMDDMMAALKGFATQVGIAFAPSMTILVKAFTDIIVYTKNVFNQLSDAGSVLAIRIGAMVASAQLLAKQLFSMTVFSKEAWQATMDQVKGIDQWAAAQIKAVAIARDSEKGLEALAIKQMDAAQAAERHAASQQKLGENIVKATQIQLHQIELAGKHQERQGGDIVAATQVENAIKAAEGQRQERLGRQINDEFAVSQRIAQEWVDSYMIQEDAATERFQAEMVAVDRNQEHLGRYIVASTQGAQQIQSFWDRQMKALVESNSFSISQITTAWTSGLANTIVNFQNFGDAMTQIGKQTAVMLLQGVLNLGVQQAAEWGLQAVKATTIKSAEAAAVVAINAEKNAAIIAADAAGASGLVSIWSGAGAAMVGLFGTISGAVEGLVMGTIFPALIEAGTAVITFLGGIASALDASIFGIPFSVPVWAAVALVGAAIGTVAAFAFADGGIATGPTMGLVGEAGSPEAIIPLNSRGASFMRDALGMGGSGGPTTIIVELDGRPIVKHVANQLPSMLRLKGLPA